MVLWAVSYGRERVNCRWTQLFCFKVSVTKQTLVGASLARHTVWRARLSWRLSQQRYH